MGDMFPAVLSVCDPAILFFFTSKFSYLLFIGLAYQGIDIVFRFITIEYSSLRVFGP
jgi:hypothetical protein